MDNPYENSKYLDKLHRDILTIMDEIDRVCRNNSIRYYLMCGSCLGAVRHNGFIPWDDDLDIAIPRADFDRLIKLITNNSILDDAFYLRWVTTDQYYNQPFAKICLKGTVFQEDNGLSAKSAGIFVDIFPLDPCDPYSRFFLFKDRIIRFLDGCNYYRGADPCKYDWKLKHWPRNLMGIIFSNRTIYKILRFVIGYLDEQKADYQAYFATPYPINRQFFPKNWHGKGRKILFEGRYYVCPDEAEMYLERIYGTNYMELPPANKRKTHYPIRVVFSDGEEMLFEAVKNKIDYKDVLD